MLFLQKKNLLVFRGPVQACTGEVFPDVEGNLESGTAEGNFDAKPLAVAKANNDT